MSTFAKVMVVVNLILAIAFLASAGTLHGAAESWKSKHDQVMTTKNEQIAAQDNQLKAKGTQLEQAAGEARSLDAAKQTAEGQLKLLNDSNGVLNRELENKTGEIKKLQDNLTDATNAVKDQTARNEQLANQLAQAVADLKQTQEKLATAEENGARETARADNAEAAVAAAAKTNKSVSENLDATSTALLAYQKKFGPLGDAVAVKPVSGVVQAASSKDDVFVVSVGSADGVKVGYEFTVSRGPNYVSTIVIDSVFANHAAGHTKSGMKKMDVQSGDKVATVTGL